MKKKRKSKPQRKPPLKRLMLDITDIGRNKGLKWSNGGLNRLLAEIRAFRLRIGGRGAQFNAKLRYAKR